MSITPTPETDTLRRLTVSSDRDVYCFNVTIDRNTEPDDDSPVDGCFITSVTVTLTSEAPSDEKQLCFETLRAVFHHENIPRSFVQDNGNPIDTCGWWSGNYVFEFHRSLDDEDVTRPVATARVDEMVDEWLNRVREYTTSSGAVEVLVSGPVMDGQYHVKICMDAGEECTSASPPVLLSNDDNRPIEGEELVDHTLRILQQHIEGDTTEFVFKVDLVNVDHHYFSETDESYVATQVSVSLFSGVSTGENQICFDNLREVFYSGDDQPRVNKWDGLYDFEIVKNISNDDAPNAARDRVDADVEAWLQQVRDYEHAITGSGALYWVTVHARCGFPALDHVIEARVAEPRDVWPYTTAHTGRYLSTQDIRRLRAGRFVRRTDLVVGARVRASSGYMFIVTPSRLSPYRTQGRTEAVLLQQHPMHTSYRNLQFSGDSAIHTLMNDRRFVRVRDKDMNTFDVLVGYSLL